MRKYEFLTELQNKLQGLPKDEIENRVNFYREMIEDRMDEGKSEEQAVAEVGDVDDIVRQIASETPFVKLVKEKAKPKRSLRGWEIALLILGSPLWFPLMLTGMVLCLVFYLLVWILVIVTYVVELALIASSVVCIVAFFVMLFQGNVNLMALGGSIMCAGAALLFLFACIGATKVTLKLSKSIMTGIKTSFVRKGAK